MKNYILAINPGSTSTKFALFESGNLIFEESAEHSNLDLQKFRELSEQFNFRKSIIVSALERRGIDQDEIRAVVGRGGLLKPIESGIYEVNEKMRQDLISGERGSHASNLGGLIASDIVSDLQDARAFIVDPVVVDEMQDIARIAGHPEFKRRSIFHALNHKAVARHHARAVGRVYEEMNIIVAHMGGGVTVGAHRRGRVVDVNNGFDGDGPFSPERSGSLPCGQLVELCYGGSRTKEEVLEMLTGKGGMVAYFGTNDFREVCRLATRGEVQAKLIQEAVSYQIGKEIGAMAAVLHGEVDIIILTGGMAYQELHTTYIKSMVAYVSDVVVYPGEGELNALAFNGLRVLKGEVEPKIYR